MAFETLHFFFYQKYNLVLIKKAFSIYKVEMSAFHFENFHTTDVRNFNDVKVVFKPQWLFKDLLRVVVVALIKYIHL